MKAVFALCLLTVASAAVIPITYNTGFLPYGTAGAFPFTAGAFPYTTGFVPQTYRAALPTTYAVAPVQVQAVQTSVVAPGYVAKTPGAEHVAPLPAGLGYASHHINLASAPGTA